MKRLFLDTNVILDLLAERTPFYDSIAKLATLADQKQIALFTSAVCFTTTDYILSKIDSRASSVSKLRKFSVICKVAEANQDTIDKALNSSFPDFEDAVQYFCALQSDCDVLISRNGSDFKKSAIPVMTAEEFLKSMEIN